MDALRQLLKRTTARKDIRISCSDVAAIAGFHPWADFVHLMDKYLYQDLSLLRDLDAHALGVEFVSVDDEVDTLLTEKLTKQGGTEGQQVCQTLQEIKRLITLDETALQTQQQTKDLMTRVQSIVETQSMKQSLTEEERRLVHREFDSRIKRQYGVNCEDQALDRYEQETGFAVTRRNEQFYVLTVPPFEADADSEEEIEVALTTHVSTLKRKTSKAGRQQLPSGQQSIKLFFQNSDNSAAATAATTTTATNQKLIHKTPSTSRSSDIVIDMVSDEDSDNSVEEMDLEANVQELIQDSTTTDNNNNSSISVQVPSTHHTSETPSLQIESPPNAAMASTTAASTQLCKNVVQKLPVKRRRIAFSLIGKVDGISSQIDSSSEDCAFWKPIEVVVEIKNRVSKCSQPPPLYDQIQLVAYLLMTQCSCGDLVQSIPSRSVETNRDREQSTMTSTLVAAADFTITRVYLDGPPYHHHYHWDTVILPRLHVFNDAIHLLRQDDSLRHAFLLANENDKLSIISNLCPYITF
jgi:hypothetical protein